MGMRSFLNFSFLVHFFFFLRVCFYSSCDSFCSFVVALEHLTLWLFEAFFILFFILLFFFLSS